MDVVFVAVGLACFALGVLYVRGCDRIVGREKAADTAGPTEPEGPR